MKIPFEVSVYRATVSPFSLVHSRGNGCEVLVPPEEEDVLFGPSSDARVGKGIPTVNPDWGKRGGEINSCLVLQSIMVHGR